MARPLVDLTPAEWTTLGQFVVAHRTARGWSQEQALARVDKGISKAPMSHLESGSPRSGRMARTSLEAIQRLYDLPAQWWELVLAGQLDPPASDSMDTHSRLARLPDESRARVIAAIDEEERKLQGR